MHTTLKLMKYSERLSWGFTLMAAALLLSTILEVNTLLNLSVQFDPSSVSSGQVSPLQMVLGCVSPLGTLLTFVAIVLILMDSSRIKGKHRGMAITGLVLFLFSLVASGLTIILSINAARSGDIRAFSTIIWLQSGASVFGTLVFLLMAAVIAETWIRWTMVTALVVSMVGTVGQYIFQLQNLAVQSYDLAGTTVYIPAQVNRSVGIYPLLALLSVVGMLLFLASYADLAVLSWRAVSSEVPETVA